MIAVAARGTGRRSVWKVEWFQCIVARISGRFVIGGQHGTRPVPKRRATRGTHAVRCHSDPHTLDPAQASPVAAVGFDDGSGQTPCPAGRGDPRGTDVFVFAFVFVFGVGTGRDRLRAVAGGMGRIEIAGFAQVQSVSDGAMQPCGNRSKIGRDQGEGIGLCVVSVHDLCAGDVGFV